MDYFSNDKGVRVARDQRGAVTEAVPSARRGQKLKNEVLKVTKRPLKTNKKETNQPMNIKTDHNKNVSKKFISFPIYYA